MFRIIILLSVLSCGLSEDKKWVWGANGRKDGGGSSELRAANDYLSRPRPKYEISEFVEGIASHAQVRPQNFRPPTDYDERPFVRPEYNRPTGLGNFGTSGSRPGAVYNQGGLGTTGPRPGGVYNQGGFGTTGPRPGGVYNQGGFGQNVYNQGSYGQGAEAGILTGPVPSWQKEPPVKEFDKCKCTEKFNCNSPGLSYGHCDVGKQYCCYNSQGNALAGGPIPSRPINSIANGILSGPGGPVDHIPNRRPVGFRPNQRPGPYDFTSNGRPQIGAGVLVGPGGPTGIIGRPTGNGGVSHAYDNRPYGGSSASSNGILVGPGGPYDRPYNNGYGNLGLGRSDTNTYEKEDRKDS